MAVPEGRIFLINSMGELHNINHTYRQTYLSLSRHVDLTFPPLPHDGADDSCDDHDTGDDHEDEDDVADSDCDGSFDHDRGLIDNSSGNNSSSSAGGNVSVPTKLLSLSSSSSVAAGGVDGSGSGVAETADDGKAGGGDGGGAYVHPALATGGAVAVGDAPRDIGNKGTLGDENGSVGSGDRGRGEAESSRGIVGGFRPALAKSTTRGSASSAAGTAVMVVAAAAKAKAKAKAATLVRKWEEVAPRREKSFYPNRAAVEDRFTDLNFWREPPPLIGDYDEDDGDSQEEDDSQDEEEDGADDKPNREEELEKKELVQDGPGGAENGAI